MKQEQHKLYIDQGPTTEPITAPARPRGRAERSIAIALELYPDLGVCGFGNPNGGLIVPSETFKRQVEYRCEWIGWQRLTRRVQPGYNSYGYKHQVERWCGEYIPNGAFIAAALGMGLAWKRGHRGSPNAVFSISSKTVTPPIRPEV